MKNIQRYAIFFVAIIMVATSCKKSVPAQTKYIPKDAMFVFEVNWKSLSEKASKANINWDSLYSSMSDKETDSIMRQSKQMMHDFMRSGVDTTKDIFFYANMGSSVMNGQSFSGGVIAAMSDATSFEKYIKGQPRAGDIQKGKDYSYAQINGEFYVGWNSDVIIVAGSSNTKNFKGESNGDATTINGDAALLATLFAQKEEESVASIPEFRDLMGEKGDMLFWSNSSGIFNSVPILSMTKIADLFKGSYSAGVVSFEDGKVEMKTKSYSGKDLAAIWEKYKGPEVNMDMVNQFPSPIEGYAAFSFNPQIIAEIVKYGGLENTVKQFMEKAGFTMDDVLKIFKGDFAVVFSNIGYEETTYNFGGEDIKMKKPGAKLIFNAAIGDKAAYDKVMSKLAETGEVEMRNGQYVPKMPGGMAWNMDGKNLIIATDSTLLQQYLAGKGNAAVPADIAKDSKGKSTAVYVDIANIIAGFTKDTSAGKSLQTAQATFKNATMTSSNYNGKYVEGNMQLNMVNDKENSLASLVKFFVAVSQDAMRFQNRMNHEMMNMDNMDDMDMDSMEVPPPPAEKEN